jgi:hypothetical protein
VSGRTLAAPAGDQPNIAISPLKGAMLRPNCLKIGLAGSRGDAEQVKKRARQNRTRFTHFISSNEALTLNI